MRLSLIAPFALVAAASVSAARRLQPQPTFTPAAYDTWIWNGETGNVCADGSPTGFAYNMHANATELLFYLAAGGACWDTNTCFTNPSAINLQGFNESRWETTTKGAIEWLQLTSRTPSRGNPWASANFVYVPYCTGDFHSGDNVHTYPGAPAPIHHRGFCNFQNILAFAKRAAPKVQNVWITGTSAGCYGATLNYVPTQKVFASAQVHLIGDSCVAVPGMLNTKPSWKGYQPSGRDCPQCQSGEFNSFLPALSMKNPKSRFASISFEVDNVLPGYNYVTLDGLAKVIKSYFAKIAQTRTGMAQSFTVLGKGHCVLYEPAPVSATGVTLTRWLAAVKDLRPGSRLKSV